MKPDQWEAKLEELKEYKDEFDNCNVVQTHGSLGRWVDQQRAQYRAGKLSDDRLRGLENLGFEWSPGRMKPDQWKAKCNELISLLGENKTEPQRQQWRMVFRDPALQRWVDYQRESLKKGKLTAERATKLISMGFLWVGKFRGRNRVRRQVELYKKALAIANNESTLVADMEGEVVGENDVPDLPDLPPMESMSEKEYMEKLLDYIAESMEGMTLEEGEDDHALSEENTIAHVAV